MNPDGIDIFNLVKMVTPNIAYYLPRSLDSSKVISLADKVCEIEEVHLNDRGVKCILVYYGDLITKEEDEF